MRGIGDRVTAWLAKAPSAAFVAYATLTAFSTYFCMYAFRKPVSAASFDGERFFGGDIGLKTALLIAQLVGYTASKYVGVKALSELPRVRRVLALIGMIVFAEGALVLLAVLPRDLKPLAMLLNGLPLGMVWGLVVAYLEGRRTSELLLAGLSCAFIVASGAVKDVGRYLMAAHDVPEATMPMVAGALFFPLFVVSVWLLDRIPPPTAEDEAARTTRTTMDGAQRVEFMRHFWPGLVPLLGCYFFLTAYRDYRDNYGVEIIRELGVDAPAALFTATEIPVALGVIGAMAALNLVRDRRRGLLAAYAVMILGAAVMGIGALLLDLGCIDGPVFLVLVGLGSYFAYVPYGSVLFDRLIAATRVASTAVFTIYVADAIGYTGSIGVQLGRDLWFGGETRVEFFRVLTYAVSVGSVLALAASYLYFDRRHLARDQQSMS